MNIENFNKDIELLKNNYKVIIKKIEKDYGEEFNSVLPPKHLILDALSLSIPNIKVVICSQDPYFNEGQANGNAFSVNDGVKIPPSLENIFKELKNDLGLNTPVTGNLSKWKEQGVLLLNRVLTVELGKAKSHSNKYGWEVFTDKLIKLLNDHTENTVFLLWGADAQEVEPLIDKKRHLVLKAAHPSPLAAKKGFFGCMHFSKANNYLVKNNKTPIDWSI